MNCVWASSPTSGNERLVLLALANACSRDDGTDAGRPDDEAVRFEAITGTTRQFRQVLALPSPALLLLILNQFNVLGVLLIDLRRDLNKGALLHAIGALRVAPEGQPVETR